MKIGRREFDALAASPVVASWFTDADGLWVTLRDGWQADGLHCLHLEPCDYSPQQLRRELADVKPCSCTECEEETRARPDAAHP